MSSDLTAGVWIYRSFLNLTQEVDDFNELKFGQGELIFEDVSEPGTLRGQLAFRSFPPKADDPRLVLSGFKYDGNPYSLRFQGTGVKETSAEGWVYQYVGYFIPKWPDGKRQRSVIVGSVIRSVPHDGCSDGIVGSFIAVQKDFIEPRNVIPLPNNVRDLLASRHHRLHHAVWHSVRNRWLSLTESQRQQIRALEWRPGGMEFERPSLSKKGDPILNNGSGEDFLFMHREMIREVHSMMTHPIKGWTAIPAPGSFIIEQEFASSHPTFHHSGNPDGFAVPKAWINNLDEETNRRIKYIKTDGFYWSRMRWWDREFKNSQYLSTLTLGELGALIEWSVHNDMHMRWASVPRDPSTGEPLPEGRKDNDIDKVWDTPDYDFLGDFYSSHVNPIFWRLHGWIDDRIGDWFQAHEKAHPGEVKQSRIKGVPWFKKGKWVHSEHPWSGPAMSKRGHHDIEKMEKVICILYGEPTYMQEVPNGKVRFTWF
ncbi:hypothetical protein ACSSTO_03950 [Bacillus atrophaeus]|uniref:hypothetical protein n=1 Tax=Bacillus atrophaeus TaxID=1452 RepID=UPI003EDA32DF